MVKKKKRSFMSKLFSRRILLLIQFIVSIIFLGCIYILKMLPMKYYLILCGIIFLLWMLSSLLIKSGIKKKKRENIVGRIKADQGKNPHAVTMGAEFCFTLRRCVPIYGSVFCGRY